MTVLYIKLKNDVDIIANTSESIGSVTLDNPVRLVIYGDQMGMMSITFVEWIPSSLVQDPVVTLDRENVLFTLTVNDEIKTSYLNWVDEIKRKEKQAASSKAESYQSILDSISSHKRPIH